MPAQNCASLPFQPSWSFLFSTAGLQRVATTSIRSTFWRCCSGVGVRLRRGVSVFFFLAQRSIRSLTTIHSVVQYPSGTYDDGCESK